MTTAGLTRATTRATTGSLVPRRYRYGGGAYSPTSRFSGGVAGLLIDGIASTFLQSEGGAAAGNADPLGYVTDISGNGNHLNQTTGALRQQNLVEASVNGIYLQPGCTLPVTMAAAIEGAYSFVSVAQFGPAGTSFLNFYSGNNYVASVMPNISVYVSNTEYLATDITLGGKFIIHHYHAGGGANEFVFKVYDMAGAVVGTGATTVAAYNHSTLYSVGYTAGTPSANIVYQMELNAVIDTADFEANDLPYLVSRFAAWGAV